MARRSAGGLIVLAVVATLLTVPSPPVGAAKPVGETRIFTRVPAPGHPEGILVRDGVVYVGTHTSMMGNAGGEASRIFRYDLESGREIDHLVIQGQTLSEVHGLVGMGWGPDGRLYVADRSPPRVLAIDVSVSPPTQTTYALLPDLPRCSSAPPPCAPSNHPGESLVDGLIFDATGALYVSDVQRATIFRVRPGGGPPGEIWFQDPRLDGPFGVNGLAIDPSGQRLYMAVTISNPPDSAVQGSIYTLPLTDRPGPGDLTLIHRYPEPMAAPDGILFGRSGRLYVTLAGANQIAIHDPSGTELSRFPTASENARQEVPWDTPASMALDGRGSLLVTNQSYINAVPQHWVVFTSWVDDLPL